MEPGMIKNIFKSYLNEENYDKIYNSGKYLIERVFINQSKRNIEIITKYYSYKTRYRDLGKEYNISGSSIGRIILRFNNFLRYEVEIFLNNSNKESLSDFKIKDMKSELGTILQNSLMRYFRNHLHNIDPTLQDVKNLDENILLNIRNLGDQSYKRLIEVIKEKEIGESKNEQ